MRHRSILLASAAALLFAGPAHANGVLTIDPTIRGAGTVSAADGYGCLLPPANVNPANTVETDCPPKIAAATARIENGIPVKWSGPALDAGTSAVAIEKLEIAHEKLTLTLSPGRATGAVRI